MRGAGPSTERSFGVIGHVGVVEHVSVIEPGRIVVLNGTSSSGKTSIADAFQELRGAGG